MNHFFFDKSNSLVQISNSILKHFTGSSFHDTSKELDEVFAKKQYTKVSLMLFDGLGKSIRELHLNEKDFLRRKKAFTINSVFPPTTVAATTAVCSGKYPIETGWLGWRQYFKSHNLVVDMFTNANSVTHEKVPGPVLSKLYCDYTPIWDIISKHKVYSTSLYPYPIDPLGPKSLDEFFACADRLLKKEDSHFYYMYYPEPDSTMHMKGINSPLVRRLCKEINKNLAKLAKDNKDNLIIVLSDHSMVDTKYFNIYEHEDFSKMLKTINTLDARSCFFNVKEEYLDLFADTFNKYYKDYFVLKTKKEVLEEKWFGEGTPHPLFEDFLGDFLATSISGYGFTYEDFPLVANHAGSLEEESLIDVSILNI